MATLDQKTSDICRDLDGNVYDINDSNKPIPPEKTHVGCRSCLVSIPSKEWRPKKRMDNETKEHITYANYKEWKKENNIQTLEEENSKGERSYMKKIDLLKLIEGLEDETDVLDTTKGTRMK